ncbi:hypothetical protein B0H17DRAFT_1221761 [Mycena rosella]|uniref:Uncharacterized protein n=1 Tax=Mycena rosella TaxID=1033263 RepID=A0AAD7F736_MYCRO|nr:hypothetical protein B0H17DRAFT_1221761 [Mycena rosella]
MCGTCTFTIWVIARFVKPSSTKKSTGSKSKSEFAKPVNGAQTNGHANGGLPLTTGNINGTASDPADVANALLARAARDAEGDASVCVSQLCFKHGRITVPPAVVLACNGFYAAPDSPPAFDSANGGPSTQADGGHTVAEKKSKSKTALPPYYATVRALTRSMPALATFYRGGCPRPERWWETAFATCAAELAARRVPFGARGLSGGLEGVRALGS